MQTRKVSILLSNGAQEPRYGSAQAHGADVCAYIPDDDFGGRGGCVVIHPGERVFIKTGVYLALPEDMEVQVRPRSGLALNHGITVLNAPGTIDSDYRGEVGVILINHGQREFVVNHGDRIAQLVFVQNITQAILKSQRATPEELERFTNVTDRGAGGFGSTGTK